MAFNLFSLRRGLRLTSGGAETFFTVLVLLLLFWQSLAFYDDNFFRQGSGDRYVQDQARGVNVPNASATLAAACALSGRQRTVLQSKIDALQRSWLDLKQDWQASLCEQVKGGDGSKVAEMIASQLQATQDAFALGIHGDTKEKRRKIQEARLGKPPQVAQDPNAKTEEDDTAKSGQDGATYRRAYGLEEDSQYSRPLACALDWLNANTGAGKALGEVDARLLAAAVLAGKSSAVNKWAKGAKNLPAFDAASPCEELGAPLSVVTNSASLMARAHASIDTKLKGQKAEQLPKQAFWILAGYALLGLFLLKIGRKQIPLPRFLFAGLMLWSLAGWISRVRLPEGFSANWQTWFFPCTAAICGLILLLMTLLKRHGQFTPKQIMSSRGGYAGFVLLVGLGWWLLIDLSAHGHLKNRFLALYQQPYIFAAFILISLLPTLRFPLMRILARLYALMMATQASGFLTGWRRWLPWLIPTLMVLLPLLTVFHHQRQFTSELLRVWFVLGVAWFLFIRGESIVRSSSRPLLLRSLLPPLGLFVLLLVVGQAVTNDFGPLLVTLYGSAVLVGGLTVLFLEEAGHRSRLAIPVGMLVTVGWIVFWTVLLFTFGSLHSTTAERLNSLKDPFSAANDQMAIIHDFRNSIPLGTLGLGGGYGLGEIPWCGEQFGSSCNGVPLQVQSDYTFTALQGVWGVSASYFLLTFVFFWLGHLLRCHDKVTGGRPDHGSRYAGVQAWSSWIALCWSGLLLAQVAVTVSGNLGWLPLSGITFPFVSYGAWSLLTNTIFLGLAINLLSEKQS